MKNHSKRLYALIGSVVLLLIVLVLSRNFFRSPDVIGDFQVPTLAGWDRKITKTARSHEAAFEKKGKETRLYIKLGWNKRRLANPPKNTQDLLSEVAQNRSTMAGTFNSLGMNVNYSPPQVTTINGMPAVLSKAVIKDESSTTYAKSYLFVDGWNFYNLTANIDVPGTSSSTPPPDLQAEMDQALAEIKKSLRPSS